MNQAVCEKIIGANLLKPLIDTTVFGGSVYIANKACEKIRVGGLRHYVIYFVIDWLIRNKYFSAHYFSELIKDKNVALNAYISVINWIVSSIWDGFVDGGSINNAIMQNAIRNGVGFLGNGIIDMVLPEKY